MTKRKRRIVQHWDDRLFDIINYTLLAALFIAFLYPVWFVVIASVSDPSAVTAGEVTLLPVGFDLAGYKRVIQNPDVWMGYANTIYYTVAGTILNVAVTAMAGYALSRRDLPGRGIILTLFIITMYFGGGMIPSYLNVKSLGLTNTRTLMLIMGLINVTNLIICRTFFSTSIPWELHEAAFLDGASDFKVFSKVILPMAKPILAVITITHAVGHWNNYFTAMIYLKDEELYPLQMFLREILLKSQITSSMTGGIDDAETVVSMMVEQNIANQMKYALIVIATLPILAIYPWLEKYFEKGFTIGSVKG